MMKTSLLSLIVLLALTSCSNSEQEEMEARRKRVEQRERQEAADNKFQQEAVDNTNRAQEETERLAAEAAEPEYSETEFFYVTVGNKTVKCEELTLLGCGVSFNHCDNGKKYLCMHNAEYFEKTEKVLVEN